VKNDALKNAYVNSHIIGELLGMDMNKILSESMEGVKDL
jgi:hypothetical protein